MIQNEAYGRPDGGELRPEDRHDQADPGDRRRPRQLPAADRQGQAARPCTGRTRPRSSATARRSPTRARTEANWEADSYKVETFKVNVPVKKGQQLALRGNYTSMVRCSSGGDNTLIYQPPLLPAAPSPRPATPTAAGS